MRRLVGNVDIGCIAGSKDVYSILILFIAPVRYSS